MAKKNTLTEFFSNNALQILIIFVGLVAAWTMLTARLTAVEASVETNSKALGQMTDLVERIIVLEERENTIQKDIDEIKQDIKEIKNALRIGDSSPTRDNSIALGPIPTPLQVQPSSPSARVTQNVYQTPMPTQQPTPTPQLEELSPILDLPILDDLINI